MTHERPAPGHRAARSAAALGVLIVVAIAGIVRAEESDLASLERALAARQGELAAAMRCFDVAAQARTRAAELLSNAGDDASGGSVGEAALHLEASERLAAAGASFVGAPPARGAAPEDFWKSAGTEAAVERLRRGVERHRDAFEAVRRYREGYYTKALERFRRQMESFRKREVNPLVVEVRKRRIDRMRARLPGIYERAVANQRSRLTVRPDGTAVIRDYSPENGWVERPFLRWSYDGGEAGRFAPAAAETEGAASRDFLLDETVLRLVGPGEDEVQVFRRID